MSQTVGMPVSDYLEIVSGNSIKDNANTDMLIPEAQHFQIASTLAKQAALNILPPELAQLHINGDLHVHDLDRFGECSFCRTGGRSATGAAVVMLAAWVGTPRAKRKGTTAHPRHPRCRESRGQECLRSRVRGRKRLRCAGHGPGGPIPRFRRARLPNP